MLERVAFRLSNSRVERTARKYAKLAGELDPFDQRVEEASLRYNHAIARRAAMLEQIAKRETERKREKTLEILRRSKP